MFGNSCTPVADSCQCMPKPIKNLFKKEKGSHFGIILGALEFKHCCGNIFILRILGVQWLTAQTSQITGVEVLVPPLTV